MWTPAFRWRRVAAGRHLLWAVCPIWFVLQRLTARTCLGKFRDLGLQLLLPLLRLGGGLYQDPVPGALLWMLPFLRHLQLSLGAPKPRLLADGGVQTLMPLMLLWKRLRPVPLSGFACTAPFQVVAWLPGASTEDGIPLMVCGAISMPI